MFGRSLTVIYGMEYGILFNINVSYKFIRFLWQLCNSADLVQKFELLTTESSYLVFFVTVGGKIDNVDRNVGCVIQ